MIPAPIIAILAVAAVLSAAILVRGAVQRPWIGALVERAIIAVLIAFLGVIYAFVALDTDAGRVVLSTDAARLITRAAVVALLAIPAVWVALYLSGRLGE